MKHKLADLFDHDLCPDWMHIRQYVYLLKTHAPILLQAVNNTHIRLEGRRGRTEHHAPGFTAHRSGGRCAFCKAPISNGDRLMYGPGGVLGHVLCHGAHAAITVAAQEAQRERDAAKARNRRKRKT